MAAEPLRGRQRRYFGYMTDITHKIDTPESAKSYRSIMSPVKNVKWTYEPVKSFKPDPPGHTRFADKILHGAVKTQVPGLLPSLKNSPQYQSYEDNAINLRSPEFEQHFERSLHYFWLPPNERTELCDIIQSHVKPIEKRKIRRFISVGKQKQLTGLAAETAILEQQEYLDNIANDPRFASHRTRVQRRRRMSEVPERLSRMNRKFQISYWDPTFNKSLTDPFRRGRGKLPACDAICHQEFGNNNPEYRDLLTCVEGYNRRYEEQQDLSGEAVELAERRDQLRRLSLYGTLDDEERRRGFKHIKPLREFDRESDELWTKQAKLMISAAEYINKIKNGRRFPTPPRELNGSRGRDFEEGTSNKSDGPSINVEEYLQQAATGHMGGQAHGHENPHKQKWRRRKHFHHNYNSEDFYMEMYLHFLNPDEDVSLKAPPKQMTDVKELRRKMNLDVDQEEEKKLVDMLNDTSVEALKTVHGEPSRKSKAPSPPEVTEEDLENEKEILEKQLARLNNPRLTHILTRMMSQISIKASSVTMTSSGSRKTPDSGGEAAEEATDQTSSQQPTLLLEGTTTEPSIPPVAASIKTVAEKAPEKHADIDDDDDLDVLGDIPEHELRLIMSEIAVSSKGSGSIDNLSSDSSGGEQEEMEGEGEDAGDDEALKLFKKARKKKDSLAELMDLTTEFRNRVCQGEMGRVPGNMNPFAEAVCVLYPEGSDRHHKRKSKAVTKVNSPTTRASLATTKRTSKASN